MERLIYEMEEVPAFTEYDYAVINYLIARSWYFFTYVNPSFSHNDVIRASRYMERMYTELEFQEAGLSK